MLKFKRNFSIRDSPAKSNSISLTPSASRTSSPGSKRICLTVTPRKSIWEETPKKTKAIELIKHQVDTPSPTPIPLPSQLTAKKPVSYPGLSPIVQQKLNEKVELMSTSESLQDRIDNVFQEVVALKEKIVEEDLKRLEFDDLLGLAATCQVIVRNLLNEMYNTGNDIAADARTLFEEVKNNHQKKFDKLAFAANHRMDNLDAEITKSMKQLEHEIELNKRIRLTLECQNQSQTVKELSTEKEQRSSYGQLMIESATEAVQQKDGGETDEDCVIIEQEVNQVADGAPSEVSNQTLEQQEEITEASTEGNIVAEEDEETDVEEEKEVEEDTFTPCQAQKPH